MRLLCAEGLALVTVIEIVTIVSRLPGGRLLVHHLLLVDHLVEVGVDGRRDPTAPLRRLLKFSRFPLS